MHETSTTGWQRMDLSKFTTNNFSYGKGRVLTNLWGWLGSPLLRFSPTGVTGGKIFNWGRIWLLRLFGAEIGKNVIVNPCRIHLPWRLLVGDNSWIGSDCDIYNLAPVTIGRNVCISQRAYLCTGNHDYTSPRFDLIVKGIDIKDASWICASAFIGPGVTLHEGSIVVACSVVTKSVPAMMIVRGNPAQVVAQRSIQPC
jgi:putative colanic acid biosynthesis acetyltransferase WcaF